MASVIERLTSAGVTPAEVHAERVRRGAITILGILDDLPWFKTAASWKAWRSFLCAVYALPMDREELAIFQECCQRNLPPARKVKEAWMAVGRRGKKSSVGSLIGVYEGGCRDHTGSLAPGERGRVLVISDTKENAKAIHGFTTGILTDASLSHLVIGESTVEETRLTTQVDITIRPASVSGGRSKAVVCALLDEIAFWPTRDAATPDTEVLRGIRPAMANIPGALLVAMSSPYAQRGELFEACEKHFGKEGDDILVWKASSLQMHDTPSIRAYVASEWKKDPVSAAAEVGPQHGEPGVIQFRGDVQVFVRRETVKACTIEGVYERPPSSTTPARRGEQGPRPARLNYHAFVDVSGGSSDAFTLAIAHWDPAAGPEPTKDDDRPRGRAVLDLIRKWPAPFKPGQVTKACADDVKRYRCTGVQGDAYAGEWPRDQFAENGLGYDLAPKPKREIYRDVLPALNTLQVELLDNEELRDELVALERRVTAMGQEVIDHPKGGHDDVANAVAGVLLMALEEGKWMAPPKDREVHATTGDIWEAEIEEMQEQASRESRTDNYYSRWER